MTATPTAVWLSMPAVRSSMAAGVQTGSPSSNALVSCSAFSSRTRRSGRSATMPTTSSSTRSRAGASRSAEVPVAMTRAPRCRPSCTAAAPVPPLAPCTSNTSPACSCPRTTSATQAGSPEKAMQVVNFLVEKIKKERK